MRGEVVVCIDFMGDMLTRLVWEDSEALVFVHTEDQFVAHEKGLPCLEPVGFPLKDVFIKNEMGDLLPYAALSRRSQSAIDCTYVSSA